VTLRHPLDELPGLLLGELPPATAVAVDRHLAGCDPCRRDLAVVAVASSALRDASRLPFPAAGLPPLPASAAGLGPGEESPPGPAPPPAAVPRDRRRRGRRLLGAAAVVLALALGIGVLTLSGDREAGRGQTVALAAPAGGASAQARMRGAGDDQVMTITASSLPQPPAGAWYAVWLVGEGGEAFPVGVLAPDGRGIWSLPADVAARYRAIDVTLERADGDPSRSDRSVLRGSYA
jgi:Anti-sigma-K factor rskA, C-terminal/Putative zinc-finger